MVNKTCKLWVARDKSGELCLYADKPHRRHDWGIWQVVWLCDIFSRIPNNLFPDLTWEDEPIEVELRPAITDLDAKAQEYADSVTDNEEIKELIINAFMAGYNS